MILRYRGCLAAIAPRQARALSLRTGIGLRRKYSAAETARALGVSIRREHQIERAAVAALARADRHEQCAGGAHATTAAPARVLLAGAPAFGLPQQASPAGATAVSAAFASHTERRRASGNGGARSVSSAALVPPLPHSGSGSLTAYLLLALLVATVATALLLRLSRSRLAPARWSNPAEDLAAYRGAGPPGPEAALSAYPAGDNRGDPAAASDLGALLEQHGDIDGARAAYRRADDRGDPRGAFNLGALLAREGDLAGARDAFRRASGRKDPQVSEEARAALRWLTRHIED